MGENSPWKTPFGKVLIASSIIAAVVGFSLAAGIMSYFRTTAASASETDANLVSDEAVNTFDATSAEPSDTQSDEVAAPVGPEEASSDAYYAPQDSNDNDYVADDAAGSGQQQDSDNGYYQDGGGENDQ
jgi:hypothetical protein